MKALVEYLNQKNLIFKSLKEITPKELGSRKKVSIHLGVELKENYYAMVMEVTKKSRVLRKEAGELILLHEKLEQYIGSKITKKYIIIKAPLCSHAKVMLEENGWKVWHEER
jgi:hypothetical protein